MKKRAKSIATYDFSTLYTKAPHDKKNPNFHPLLILLLRKTTKLLLDYLIMVQHAKGRKQKGDLVLVKRHLKQLHII